VTLGGKSWVTQYCDSKKTFPYLSSPLRCCGAIRGCDAGAVVKT
jgi:hypothetical protein